MPLRSRWTRRRWVPLLPILVLVGLTGAYAGPTAADPGAEAPLQTTTVFTRHEGGYHTFRIPAVVEATDGTLLAFAEARVNSPADNGDIDLVLKRSTDGGTTWGPIQVLAEAGPNKFGNPVPIVDRTTGRIVLNTTRTGGDVGRGDIGCGRVSAEDTNRAFILYSDDHGATWSEPTEITAQFKPDNWRGFVGGPGKGIQLTHGPHAGRLIIPGRHSEAPPPDSGRECSDGTDNHNHALYSDDGGTTWHLGAVDDPGSDVLGPNENSVVELADGTLYFSTRDQGQSTTHRLDTTSSDAGESFDAPYTPVNGVTTSRVQGSLVRLPATASARDRVVLSVPAHPTAREQLTLWSSFDGGKTWQPSYEVYDGPSAYSDTVVLNRGNIREIGVLFEAGDRLYTDDGTRLSYSHDIRFTRIPQQLLDRPTPPPSSTPDIARSEDALVSGRPDLARARFGEGMSLAGDYVTLPLSDRITFGEGPFTAALWFRSEYRANNLALFYGFGQYGYQPRWWLRVEPRNNRIRARLDTDLERREVEAPGDYADGQWHHVALTRDADGLTLYVDGAAQGTADPVTGTISSSDPPVGIRVGARMDGVNYPLVGDIDEVWLFDSALSAAEIAELAETNSAGGAQPAAHLPLDRITR